jgi:DNA-binding transcriptional LysR family regulator
MNAVNLRAVDLNLLTVFRAIYEERQITRAGVRLGLGQSAISHSLLRLRDLFADRLFVRTPNGVEPTPRAHSAAESIFEALATIELTLNASEAFDPAQSTRTFRIGMLDYGAALLAPVLGRALTDQAPLATVQIHHSTTDQSIERLDRGELDLVTGPFGELPARFAAQDLCDDQYVLVARRRHPGLRGKLTPQLLAGLGHVAIAAGMHPQMAVDRALGRLDLKRRIAMSVPHFATAPHAVSSSDLVAIMPRRLAVSYRAQFKLSLHLVPLELPRLRIQAVWHRRSERDPGLLWLKETIKQVSNRPR